MYSNHYGLCRSGLKMIIKKRLVKISFLLLVTSTSVSGQTFIEAVWDDLLRSSGNSYLQPDLKPIKGKAGGPAFYRDGVIYYDSVFVDYLSQNYSSAFVHNSLAYLLSHELGHFHLRHTDTHMKLMAYANTSSSSAVYSGKSKKEDLLFKESEADLYGGLFSIQAGYYSLKTAEDFLNIVYEYYQLPSDLPGYPTLDDRISLSKNLEFIVKDINEVYQIALALAFLGEHSLSQMLFKSIIRESNFITPEILHSLSFSLFLSTVGEIDNDLINEWQWPVEISFEAFKDSKERGLEEIDLMKNLEEALTMELEALKLEQKKNSNLKESIELIQAYITNDLVDFLKNRELDKSLRSLGYRLIGKVKKANKYLRVDQEDFTDASAQEQESKGIQNIDPDILLDLRFSDSKNLILSGKRIAKKHEINNFIWYELRNPNGVRINLYREEITSNQLNSLSQPQKTSNSITFYKRNKSIKYILQ